MSQQQTIRQKILKLALYRYYIKHRIKVQKFLVFLAKTYNSNAAELASYVAHISDAWLYVYVPKESKKLSLPWKQNENTSSRNIVLSDDSPHSLFQLSFRSLFFPYAFCIVLTRYHKIGNVYISINGKGVFIK